MGKHIRHPKEKIPTLVEVLPFDILVEILTRVVASCPRPLSTLKSIKRMYMRLYQASKKRKVGFSMNLDWRDCYLEGFFTLIEHLARAGNLEANCILGLELLHNKGVKMDGIRYLWEAMERGHKVAAYLLGILLFNTDEYQLMGMQILNKITTDHTDFTEHGLSIESGLRLIRGYRTEAAKILREMTWKILFPCKPDMPCKNHCRRVVKIVDVWMDERIEIFCSPVCRWVVKIVDVWMDERIEIFCSPVCRWAYEYNHFIGVTFNL